MNSRACLSRSTASSIIAVKRRSCNSPAARAFSASASGKSSWTVMLMTLTRCQQLALFVKFTTEARDETVANRAAGRGADANRTRRSTDARHYLPANRREVVGRGRIRARDDGRLADEIRAAFPRRRG